MEAIILAGGKGTRLSSIFPDIPKPMAPVKGKPFLYYVLNWLTSSPVEKIILSVGYKHEKIIEFFGDSFGGMSVEYAIEKKALGTGGAIKYALHWTKNENILVINGDTYFPIDLNSFISFHNSTGSRFSMALKKMQDPGRYGTVECVNDTIIRFNEKQRGRDALINGGIYLINRSIIESSKLPEAFSLERDMMEQYFQTENIKGLVFEDLFIDIGIPEDYNKAQEAIDTEYK